MESATLPQLYVNLKSRKQFYALVAACDVKSEIYRASEPDEVPRAPPNLHRRADAKMTVPRGSGGMEEPPEVE